MKFVVAVLACVPLLGQDWAADMQSARSAMMKSDFAQAEELLKSAETKMSKRLGDEAPQLDSVWRMLASLYDRAHRYPEAIAIDEKRLTLWRKVAGPREVVVARTLSELAAEEWASGDLEAATQHLQQAIMMFAEKIGNQRPTAEAWMDLARLEAVKNEARERIRVA